VIRQAGESGSLYGSVSPRDIADAVTEAGLTVSRQQVVLDAPIKTLGLTEVKVVLHPEVILAVTVNVARSLEEAKKQERGEALTAVEEDEEPTLEEMLDAEAEANQPG
jgi:large subunit ribosomal protein L9